MKNGVFWDATPCGFCKTRRFGGTYRRWLVTASVVNSSLILVIVMMEAIRSSETSVLTRAAWRNILEDAILRNRYCFFRVVSQLFLGG
jgi:hypothetical protein